MDPTSPYDPTGAPTPVFGVILAGGLGTRFSRDRPKQLVTLAGRPVLAYAAHTFDTCGAIDYIVVAAHPDVLPDISEACADGIHQTPVTVVPGGDSRNASVTNAVAAIDTLAAPGATPPEEARVLVHDAVRPLASADLVRTVAERLRTPRGSPALVTVFEVARAWDPDYEITTVPGEPANIKITYPVDLAIAAYLVART